MGELSTGQSVVGSLVVAVVLAALHLAAPRIRRLPLVPERATGSFAGGLAVAYVFLHLLPEIAAGNVAIGAALADFIAPPPADRARDLPGRARRVHGVLRPRAAGDGLGAARCLPAGQAASG